jgi:hypothetical protein
MSLQGLYSAIALLGLLAEICLLVILVTRRHYKSFPVFTLYIAFNVLNDVGLAAVMVLWPPQVVRSLGLATLPLTYLLEVAVLFEIAWNVLRPVRTSLPRAATRTFIGFIVLALVGGTLLAWHAPNPGSRYADLQEPLNVTTGLLRMLIFVTTAAFAQLLGIGWKDRVLRLATGLSFYSAADLVLSLLSRQSGFSALQPLKGVAYTLELGFLVWAFTTKDVERREFSPQMEQFLVTLAGRAKLARTALVRMQVK